MKIVANAGVFGEEVAAIGRMEDEVDLAFLKEETGKAIDQALEGDSAHFGHRQGHERFRPAGQPGQGPGIFDPFFATKPVGRGRGQGPSVVHGVIVDNHGGSIRVVSTPGLGTELIIELPLSPS